MPMLVSAFLCVRWRNISRGIVLEANRVINSQQRLNTLFMLSRSASGERSRKTPHQ
jgi:hypothetical protein